MCSSLVNFSHWYLCYIKSWQFECSRIVELQKHGLSHCAIAGEIGCSETAVANFLDTEGYGKRISSGCPKKISSVLSR